MSKSLVLPINHTDLPSLCGPSCVLRPLTLENVSDDYVSWLNDKHVNGYLEARFYHHTRSSVTQYVKAQIDMGCFLFYGIWSLGGVHIGTIKLGPIDSNHFTSDIGFMLGNREYWGRGIATEAIQLLTQYAFSLGIKKITAGAYESNKGSIITLEKCGFEKEGYRKSQVVCQGLRLGTILFGLQC